MILFFTEQYYADPYPILARSRDEARVHQVEGPNGRPVWVVTRYEDARAALADPRLRKRFTPPDEPPLFHMLNADEPDHTRLRKPLTRTFTARRVEGLRSRIEEITDELLDGFAGSQVDLVADLALPLPFRVIYELLGVPATDQASLAAWGAVLSTESHDADFEAAAQAMTEYFERLVAAKRAEPTDHLLGVLTDTELTDTELVSTALLVLTAGYETTVNMISNGVLALLQHPEQLAKLRADRSLLPGAIEEVLRFDAPLTFATHRFALEPAEIGGVTIPARSVVLVGLASANRDPARFPSPDSFELDRAGGHLAFGHGIHFCLGAPLARLEGEVAFGRLLDRFASWELAVPASELVHPPSLLFRSLRSLPVRLS